MSTTIPAFHVSDKSAAEGRGEVFIASRKDNASSGVFSVDLSVHFDPPPSGTDDYPSGTLAIKADLNDSVRGVYTATSIELANSYGKSNPTIYLTGRCTIDRAPAGRETRGLRYWLLVANNKAADAKEGTPDIVGFAIHDRTGARVAYGTGPVRAGDIKVTAK
jgi:hypothetical protein